MINDQFEWNVVGLIHMDWDMRFMMDEFGTAILVPFCGQYWEFQEH